MNFARDNWAGATPEVMAALARANDGFAPAYGGDALTGRVKQLFAALFEREVEVWFTATGTASNSLGLAALSRPGGLIFCSSEAHIHVDEWGATEFQSGGMKLIPMPQADGKVSAADFATTLRRFPEGGRFGTPVALSLTNATECGTVYAPGEVAELAGMARERGLAVHMDGARFGNAVAALGASPAAATWQAGVDFLSFGGTKNGCWAAEAIVVFAPDKLGDLAARRQRAGQTLSKARFVAAQFEAYLTDGNWLRWAGHANLMAERLRAGLRASSRARLGWESTANEVFAVLSSESLGHIRAAGGSLHEWPVEALAAPLAEGEVLVRLVTSWATQADEVERFLSMV
ncbi:MAG: low specificity L-threonine aldolase [Devosia sp.]|nr:low specificity L-threonine aldolase [Devosia sp.]